MDATEEPTLVRGTCDVPLDVTEQDRQRGHTRDVLGEPPEAEMLPLCRIFDTLREVASESCLQEQGKCVGSSAIGWGVGRVGWVDTSLFPVPPSCVSLLLHHLPQPRQPWALALGLVVAHEVLAEVVAIWQPSLLNCAFLLRPAPFRGPGDIWAVELPGVDEGLEHRSCPECDLLHRCVGEHVA